MSSSSSKDVMRGEWLRLLRNGLQIDDWGGQLDESTAEYRKLIRLMNTHSNEVKLTAAERTIVESAKEAIHQRVVNIEDFSGEAGLSLQEFRQILPCVQSVFTANQIPFPLNLSRFGFSVSAGEVKKVSKEKRSKSFGRIPSGHRSVSFVVNSIGLKDAQTYINPEIVVSVVSPEGKIIEAKTTPKSNRNEHQFIQFDYEIALTYTVEDLVSQNLSVFFEFKHYKVRYLTITD